MHVTMNNDDIKMHIKTKQVNKKNRKTNIKTVARYLFSLCKNRDTQMHRL